MSWESITVAVGTSTRKFTCI